MENRTKQKQILGTPILQGLFKDVLQANSK